MGSLWSSRAFTIIVQGNPRPDNVDFGRIQPGPFREHFAVIGTDGQKTIHVTRAFTDNAQSFVLIGLRHSSEKNIPAVQAGVYGDIRRTFELAYAPDQQRFRHMEDIGWVGGFDP